MRARIRVRSFDSSMWGGMQPTNLQETVHLVQKGECIHSVGLDRAYEFQIVDIRPGSVDLAVSPPLVLRSSGQERPVDALTLQVGETIELQTLSFDAWGNWVVSLKEISEVRPGCDWRPAANQL